MSENRHQVQYGETTIEYALHYDVRSTLEISVHPDLQVVVTAPQDTDLETVQTKVHKRANWILRQQRELERYLPHLPEHKYISGETHRYLGRQYRLKVVQSEVEWVKLLRGQLMVYAANKDDPEHIRDLVQTWYKRQAQRVFRERLEALIPRFAALNIPEPRLQFRALRARWGSCTESGMITLNLKLMQVPKDYIDYVIVHELCHLVEHNHSKRFYLLLDRMMPDWRERRRLLNEYDFR